MKYIALFFLIIFASIGVAFAIIKVAQYNTDEIIIKVDRPDKREIQRESACDCDICTNKFEP